MGFFKDVFMLQLGKRLLEIKAFSAANTKDCSLIFVQVNDE